MAKKNGKDPLAHLVELMTEQLEVSRGLEARVEEIALSNVEIRDEMRSLNARVSYVVNRVSRIETGRIVEYGWVTSDGRTSWHPAVIVEVHHVPDAPRGMTLDLEVFGVDPNDRRRFPVRVIAGENAGCWRIPHLD